MERKLIVLLLTLTSFSLFFTLICIAILAVDMQPLEEEEAGLPSQTTASNSWEDYSDAVKSPPKIPMETEDASNSWIDSERYMPPNSWTSMSKGLVAHACGAVGGVAETNSLEALLFNYDMGHRVFEVDLNLTSDGILAGIHDWGANGRIRSWAELMERKIRGEFTPLSFQRIVSLLSEHRDLFIITDTKSFDYSDEDMLRQFEIMQAAAKEKDPEVLNRVVIQIYNQDMYYKITEKYKFSNIIYTLYMTRDTEDQVVEFVQKEGIKVVVMPPERANDAFLQKLLSIGEIVFLHTLNDMETVMGWKAKGVSGFYTDYLVPSDFEF
ncbi:MAG: hypothetical protein LBU32_20635 [Clostridiales bacterium]|nr:hypothetical protein [Clostridiales bacterium]